MTREEFDRLSYGPGMQIRINGQGCYHVAGVDFGKREIAVSMSWGELRWFGFYQVDVIVSDETEVDHGSQD